MWFWTLQFLRGAINLIYLVLAAFLTGAKTVQTPVLSKQLREALQMVPSMRTTSSYQR
jgi:hypothetical protein